MDGLLISTVFVRICGGPDHVSGARLANALGDKLWKNGDIQNIASVDEGASGRSWKLCKAQDGLLCGNKGTVNIDGRVATQIGQGEGEGVACGGEAHSADYNALVNQFTTVLSGRRHTIVDDDARDTKCFLNFDKGIDHIVDFRKVTRDV